MGRIERGENRKRGEKKEGRKERGEKRKWEEKKEGRKERGEKRKRGEKKEGRKERRCLSKIFIEAFKIASKMLFFLPCRSPLSSPDSLLYCSAVWSGQCDPHSAVAAPTDDGGTPVNYTITVSPGLSPVTTSGTSVLVTVPYNVIHTVSIVATNCNGSSSVTMVTIRIGRYV